MSSTATTTTQSLSTTRSDVAGRLVSLGGAALAAAVVPVMGDPLRASTAQEATDAMVASAGRLQLAAIVAVFAATGLLAAAARLGRRIPGDAGRVTTAAGALVAALLAAYYSAYAGGAVVGSLVLDEPSASLGEGALVVANMVEMTRYAPGLALLVAAVVARRHLPTTVVVAAGLLAVLTVLPFTAWAAAITVPVWLGVVGALRGSAPAGSGHRGR